MSKASKIILLCEDKLQEVFIKRFLKRRWNINTERVVKTVAYPAAKGSAEQFVRKEYPEQLYNYRIRQASANTVLIAVIDADTQTVKKRNDDFDNEARKKGYEPRMSDEPVIHIIPKRNIDSWLTHLEGKPVDEETDYKTSRYSGRESGAHQLIERLADDCRNQSEMRGAPDSLINACDEIKRIKSIIQ